MNNFEEMLAQAPSGSDYAALERIARTLELACRDRRTIFVIGNEGSASTSAHFVNDLLMGALERRSSARRGE